MKASLLLLLLGIFATGANCEKAGNVEWWPNCDWVGGDIGFAKDSQEKCGVRCEENL
jgi:hypothetical protein